MSTQRLFLALPLPPAVRQLLAQLGAPAPKLRWTPVEQLHITLRFIGDVEAGATELFANRLRTVNVQSFQLTIDGVGAFPPKSAPRVLWVGVGSGHPRLHQLRQRVDDAVLGVGVPMDVRTFHPHVTVARCLESAQAEAAAWLKSHRDFAGPAFTVEAFELYASELRASGAVHTLVERFPLFTALPHSSDVPS